MTTMTFESRPPAKDEHEDEGAEKVLAPCTDYPDDAVMEEENYSQSEPYPDSPDTDDQWLIWP